MKTIKSETRAEFLNEELEVSAYDIGWYAGYKDKESYNPFDEGTDEFGEYELGYAQGSRDC